MKYFTVLAFGFFTLAMGYGQDKSWTYSGNDCAQQAIDKLSRYHSFPKQNRPQSKDILLVKMEMTNGKINYQVESWKGSQSNVACFKTAIAAFIEDAVQCYPDQLQQMLPLIINTPDNDGMVSEEEIATYLNQYQSAFFIWEPLDWVFYKPIYCPETRAKYSTNTCADAFAESFSKVVIDWYAHEKTRQIKKDILLAKIVWSENGTLESCMIESQNNDPLTTSIYQRTLDSLRNTMVNCFTEEKYQLIPIVVHRMERGGTVSPELVQSYLAPYREKYFIWPTLPFSFGSSH